MSVDVDLKPKNPYTNLFTENNIMRCPVRCQLCGEIKDFANFHKLTSKKKHQIRERVCLYCAIADWEETTGKKFNPESNDLPGV